MSDSIDRKKKITDTLSGLIGGTIVQVEAAEDELGALWPVIIIQDVQDNIIQIEASRDTEGNGPGHIFVGLLSGDNFDEYYRIASRESWEALRSGLEA